MRIAPKGARWWMEAAPALAAACAGFAVFAATLRYGFVNYDDPQYVLDNPLIRGLDAEHLALIFTSFHFSDYLPFNLLSYAVDYHFWGLDPFGYHLTQLLWHAANCALVYALGRCWRLGRGPALFTALLFAVHPVHAETTAWIAERKNVLSFFFFVLSYLLFVRAVEGALPWQHKNVPPDEEESGARRAGKAAGSAREDGEGGPGAALPRDDLRGQALGRWWYAVSLAAFVIAVFSKSMAVTLPLVLVLHARFFTALSWRRIGALAAPYLTVSAAASVLTILSQHRVGAIDEFSGRMVWVVLTIPYTLARYLYNLAFPFHLNVYYAPEAFTGALSWSSPPWREAGAFLFWALVLLFLFPRRRPELRPVRFGLLYFVIVLLPVLNLIPLATLMADRYLYFASPGVFYAAVALGCYAWRRLAPGREAARAMQADPGDGGESARAAGAETGGAAGAETGKQTAGERAARPHTSEQRDDMRALPFRPGECIAFHGGPKAARWGLVLAAAVLVGLYAYGGQRRAGAWVDGITLWRAASARDPKNTFILTYLGNAYRDQNQPELALETYRRAVEMGSERALTYMGLGDAYRMTGAWESAAACARRKRPTAGPWPSTPATAPPFSTWPTSWP